MRTAWSCRWPLLAVAFTAVGGESVAAAQSLEGHVLEAATDRRIPSAHVSVLDAQGAVVATAVTDISGFFQVDFGRNGPFKVHATREGFYSTLSQTLNLTMGQSLTLDVRLEPLAPPDSGADEAVRGPLPPLDLLGFYKRARSEKGMFFTHFDLVAMPDAGTLLDVLRHVPTARIEPGPPGKEVLHFVGRGNRCMPGLMVDGVLVQNREAHWKDAAPLSVVEALEVYLRLHDVPREFSRSERYRPDRSDMYCGLVVAWTRRWKGGRR